MASYHPSTSAITEELQELIVCDICAEPYDNGTRQARFLDCHHTFCSQCLILLARKGQKNGNTIHCPNCRQPTHLQENGIRGLPVNFLIEKLKSISATAEKTEAVPSTEGCPIHHNQTIYFFCQTCSTAICRDCTVVDHDKTAGHSIVNITDAVDTKRHVLQQRIRVSHTTRAHIQRAIRQVELGVEKLHVCKDAVVKDLWSIVQQAHKELDQGEQMVSSVILQQYETQHKTLLDKQLLFEQANELLDKQISQSEELIKTNDISDIMKITEKLTKATEIARLNITYLDAGKIHLATDMITAATSLNKDLCHLGMKYFNSFSPTSFVLKNDKSIAGFRSVINITLLNDENNALPIASCLLSINITDPWKGTLPVTLETTQPQCKVIFTPQISGRHNIDVIYSGQKLISEKDHILVDSNNPVLKIGGPGNGNGTFRSPRDIVIDSNNCFYVADSGNGLIQKFSSNGEFLFQFRVNGHNKECTAFTLDLDLDRKLLVCTDISIANNSPVKGSTLQLFTLDGQLRHTYTLDGMSCPLHIAVQSCGNVLISDIRQKCVFKVDREGKIICGMGCFKYPAYICLNDEGVIFVSDPHGDCIYIFNADDTIKSQVGMPGTKAGQLKAPYGVATDGENILIAEGGNNHVQVIKYDGTPVSMIESTADPLNKPCGLAVTEDGFVYVVDRDNHCIKKYKYMDMSSLQ